MLKAYLVTLGTIWRYHQFAYVNLDLQLFSILLSVIYCEGVVGNFLIGLCKKIISDHDSKNDKKNFIELTKLSRK